MYLTISFFLSSFSRSSFSSCSKKEKEKEKRVRQSNPLLLFTCFTWNAIKTGERSIEKIIFLFSFFLGRGRRREGYFHDLVMGRLAVSMTSPKYTTLSLVLLLLLWAPPCSRWNSQVESKKFVKFGSTLVAMTVICLLKNMLLKIPNKIKDFKKNSKMIIKLGQWLI